MYPMRIGQYIIQNETIGRGSSATIRLAYNLQSSETICVKIFPKPNPFNSNDKDNCNNNNYGELNFDYYYQGNEVTTDGMVDENEIRRHLEVEVEILKNISDHPNIVKFIDFLEDERNYYIFQEYCKGISLLDFINDRETDGLSESEAKMIFSQLIHTLQYLHTQENIAHRDLKPENLIVCCSDDDDDENSISPMDYFDLTDANQFDTIMNKDEEKYISLKVIDFGLSSINAKGNTLLSTFCGSLHYAAPETLLREPYVGSKADIWSAGVILYAMLTGSLPWLSSSSSADDDSSSNLNSSMQNISFIAQRIVNADFTIPLTVSREAANLITRMLDPDPETRMTAREAMMSPWIMGNSHKGVRRSMPSVTNVFNGPFITNNSVGSNLNQLADSSNNNIKNNHISINSPNNFITTVNVNNSGVTTSFRKPKCIVRHMSTDTSKPKQTNAKTASGQPNKLKKRPFINHHRHHQKQQQQHNEQMPSLKMSTRSMDLITDNMGSLGISAGYDNANYDNGYEGSSIVSPSIVGCGRFRKRAASIGAILPPLSNAANAPSTAVAFRHSILVDGHNI